MSDPLTTSPAVRLPRTAVVGAGAVGGYFGGLLARAGAPVTMIGRPSFVDAVTARGLRLETPSFQETIPVEASSDLAAAAAAELILVCVKANDTALTARSLASFVAADAVVLSLQNGVDNAAQLRAAGIRHVVPTVVYVAAAQTAPGCIRHSGRGDLVLGATAPSIETIAGLFRRAGIPCRVSDNIEGDLWTKFLCNCALNAVSALGQVTYGGIAADREARALVSAAAAEVFAVARASGVVLPTMPDPATAVAEVLLLAGQISGALSSTAQDLGRGKPTEIDALNGYVARLGAALGVATPVNHALFALVKLAEGHRPPASTGA